MEKRIQIIGVYQKAIKGLKPYENRGSKRGSSAGANGKLGIH
jgi:hypothetical protein